MNEMRPMRVSRIMSRSVITAAPETTIREAAALMGRHGIGALPILEAGRPTGIVTDRDIVTRILADGGTVGETPLGEVASPAPRSCVADQDVAEAAARMGDYQIRRILVLDGSGTLVGILSLGDIAENASEELAGQALGEIVETR